MNMNNNEKEKEKNNFNIDKLKSIKYIKSLNNNDKNVQDKETQYDIDLDINNNNRVEEEEKNNDDNNLKNKIFDINELEIQNFNNINIFADNMPKIKENIFEINKENNINIISLENKLINKKSII